LAAQLQEWTAAIYLAAALAAGVGLALDARRLGRLAVGLLVSGVIVHAISFTVLHRGEGTPPLTDLGEAVSFMSWIGTLGFLALMRWAGLSRLVVLVASLAFLGVFAAGVVPPGEAAEAGGSWPHAHVLLASAGLSMAGLAGLAGLLYLVEHRRLKEKRPIARWLPMPSLEALDRVNVIALAAGFPLLTLGVAAGMLWLHSATGRPWAGSAHETWCAVAWAVYAVLALARFAARQSSRQAAASAVGGFAFLFFAVIGLGLMP